MQPAAPPVPQVPLVPILDCRTAQLACRVRSILTRDRRSASSVLREDSTPIQAPTTRPHAQLAPLGIIRQHLVRRHALRVHRAATIRATGQLRHPIACPALQEATTLTQASRNVLCARQGHTAHCRAEQVAHTARRGRTRLCRGKTTAQIVRLELFPAASARQVARPAQLAHSAISLVRTRAWLALKERCSC